MNRVAPPQTSSFFSYQPPGRPSAVVVNVPHAGEWIPEEIVPTIDLPLDVLRRDVDLAVDVLCANAPDLGAGLLVTHVSRFVVDLNRHPDDVLAAAAEPPEARPLVSYGRRGLVWVETTQGEVVVPRPLTPGEIDARRAYYHPYHRKLADLLANRRRRGGFAVLLDAHSMPSRGARGHADSGDERADFVLGDNLGKACQATLVEAVEGVITAHGYSVTRNQPYRGGYNTRYYGRPERGVHALQIEINRALYMDEARAIYQPARAEPVRRALDEVVAAVVALRL